MQIPSHDYTINAQGQQATLLPTQVVKRFSDSNQGYSAAVRHIYRLLDEHNGERWGTVLAHYAPIGKVYTAYGVWRNVYHSEAVRTGFDGDGRVFGTADPFSTQASWDVVQYTYIDRDITAEESHANGGHNFVRVKGCTVCFGATGTWDEEA